MGPQALLSRGLEARIVSFTFSAQGIRSLEIKTATVNRKPVVCGNGPVFGAAPVFLSVVPIFVVAGTNTVFGLAERTAELLACAPVIRRFPVLVHGKSGVTDRVARGKIPVPFSIALFERDEGFAGINRFDGIVDILRVITLIRKEGTLPQRNRLVGCSEDISSNSGIHDIGRSGQHI